MPDGIIALITCLSPIIVAYFGYMTTRQQKQTKEFIELQTKYNQQNENLKKQEIEEQKKAIAEIKSSVDKLQDQINKMDIEHINTQLGNIIQLSHINFEYSQSLSQVICAIGDCIENAHIEEAPTARFQQELARHQKDEREFASRILKIAY